MVSQELMALSAFGEWLLSARQSKGWSMRRLEDGADITQAYISLIESGKRAPSRDMVVRLAAALGVDPADGLVAAGFVPDGYEVVPGGRQELTATGQGAARLAAFNNAPPEVQQAVERILDPFVPRADPGKLTKSEIEALEAGKDE